MKDNFDFPNLQKPSLTIHRVYDHPSSQSLGRCLAKDHWSGLQGGCLTRQNGWLRAWQNLNVSKIWTDHWHLSRICFPYVPNVWYECANLGTVVYHCWTNLNRNRFIYMVQSNTNWTYVFLVISRPVFVNVGLLSFWKPTLQIQMQAPPQLTQRWNTSATETLAVDPPADRRTGRASWDSSF